MALTALGIDLMLPAFGAIRSDLDLPANSTAVAGLVTAYLIGLAVGQLAYGPIADRFGRRPTLFAGYVIYALAALITALAPSLPLLLAARFVWGLGAASPRVVTLAMVRDAFEGEQMARTMSMIMAVFILAPVVAPTVGATVVGFASWRWLFGVCAVAATIMAVWATRLLRGLRRDPVARAPRSDATRPPSHAAVRPRRVARDGPVAAWPGPRTGGDGRRRRHQ
jgi:DHA1 family bicyclomycin/chloramphenicol resistance-like MFS transporter